MTSAEEPQWLDDEEAAAWLAHLRAGQLLNAALDRQLQRDAGIPHSWYGILTVLASQPDGSLRQSDLAALADFSLSRLSHAVTKLENQGWVRRQADTGDRRSTLVVLTPEGAAAQAQAAPGHVAVVRELVFSRLTRTQVRQLAQISQTLLDGLLAQPDAPVVRLRPPAR